MPARPEGPPARPKLTRALIDDGRFQYNIAKAAGLTPTTLGGLRSGRIKATPNLRRRVAGALGRPEHELFD